MCKPQGINGALNVSKLYASGGTNISKSFEGGSMKLTKLVDYIYVCAVINAFPCNQCIFNKLKKCSLFFFFFFLKPLFWGFS